MNHALRTRQLVLPPQRPKVFTWTRIVALMVTIDLLTGLAYLGVSSSPETVSVPQGAHAGQLAMTRAPIPPRKAPTAPTAERSSCPRTGQTPGHA